GGGGHRNAAGGTLEVPMDEAKGTLIRAVTEELDRA
ncbi:MAG TPA: bifunctional oligoribonuclease/PAP phosphatase NrnA, partial [Desulfomicrobium sp.]|nr:bifunctional oligoribonuclease/PAP phosphatase NrnA [Desulfomicrobium sp.]